MYLKKHKVPKRQAMTMEKMKVLLADAAYPTIRFCLGYVWWTLLLLMTALLLPMMATFMTRLLQDFLARVVRYYGLPLPGPA